MPPPLPTISRIPAKKPQRMQPSDISLLKLQWDPNFPECQCLELIHHQKWRLSAHIIHLARNPYGKKT